MVVASSAEAPIDDKHGAPYDRGMCLHHFFAFAALGNLILSASALAQCDPADPAYCGSCTPSHSFLAVSGDSGTITLNITSMHGGCCFTGPASCRQEVTCSFVGRLQFNPTSNATGLEVTTHQEQYAPFASKPKENEVTDNLPVPNSDVQSFSGTPSCNKENHYSWTLESSTGDPAIAVAILSCAPCPSY